MSEPRGDVTELLVAWSSGDREVHDRLFELVYDELRRLARIKLAGERGDHTLQPTALVNDAYLRLVRQDRVSWQSRAHFFAISARMMRRILIDHARKRHAQRREGDRQKVTLPEDQAAPDQIDVDVIALDDALTKLEELDATLCEVIELRFFAGMTIEETAEAMGVSTSTVKREWRAARAWLHKELNPGPVADGA